MMKGKNNMRKTAKHIIFCLAATSVLSACGSVYYGGEPVNKYLRDNTGQVVLDKNSNLPIVNPEFHIMREMKR